jgi:hypothetical protein
MTLDPLLGKFAVEPTLIAVLTFTDCVCSAVAKVAGDVPVPY